MKKIIPLGLAFLIFLCSTLVLPVQAADMSQRDSPADIVLVADISNSMNTADKEQYLKEALKLTVDLIPEKGRFALVTVNGEIVFASDLIDVSDMNEKQRIKSEIEHLSYSGNTNLAVGIQKAVFLLKDSKENTTKRKIILISDITDGGLYLGKAATAADYEQHVKIVKDSTQEAKEQGIVIDTILLRQAPKSDSTITEIEALSSETGGQLLRIENSNRFTECIESIYFSSFQYNRSEITGINTIGGQQTMEIVLPTEHVNRARILFSSTTPVKGIQVSHPGTIATESNRSYSMVDLSRPDKAGLQISVDQGNSKAVKVYLIVDYTLNVTVTANSEVEQSGKKEFIQKTTLIADIVDTVSGKSILEDDFLKYFSCNALLTVPGEEKGISLDLKMNDDHKLAAVITPVEFGQYHLTLDIKHDGIVPELPTAKVQIDDIRPVPEPSRFTEKAAAITGGCIILIAILVFVFVRKRKKQISGELHSEIHYDYGFSGKLDVYIVWAKGGDYEIPPFTFYLSRLGNQKRINLSEILSVSNIRLPFAGAEKIWFYVGPEKTLLIKNSSKAKILFSGSEIVSGRHAKLSYGQKFYIVFEQDVDEIEIYYRNVKEGDRKEETRHTYMLDQDITSKN
ncbi:VWA domain-containing protein [Lacrimispora amygdalina]|uniref:VWA domain-containing protein n=1 Tax=Lacrimispora amygdalina TaxID=253257 RepID=A0A3E2NF68_9FIRM|nr:vWA domain-containing protein [Clostridium indicum]RFZ79603.1 VWA domain-containing protein [Clostridium indicum]